MQLADLKRAVEDVLLRPEENDVSGGEARPSIAALDLCQATPSTSSSSASCGSSSSGGGPSVATRTCSSSSETVAAGSRGSNLATSTSLDHIMLRESRSGASSGVRSGGISRRASRILPPHAHSSHLPASKRKRSNSLSSSGYYKPLSGLPPPSSLPPTARATPFREDSCYHPPHKLSLGSSESTESQHEYAFCAPPAGSLLPGAAAAAAGGGVDPGAAAAVQPDLVVSSSLPPPPPLSNGFHEDEEMECD